MSRDDDLALPAAYEALLLPSWELAAAVKERRRAESEARWAPLHRLATRVYYAAIAVALVFVVVEHFNLLHALEGAHLVFQLTLALLVAGVGVQRLMQHLRSRARWYERSSA
jgi:hypothetical protein